MGEEGGHYYNNYTFTTILKDVSGSTSIIYKYEENYTPLASGDSIYHTTTDLSNIRFHNQIMGISGEIITHTKGVAGFILINFLCGFVFLRSRVVIHQLDKYSTNEPSSAPP